MFDKLFENLFGKTQGTRISYLNGGLKVGDVQSPLNESTNAKPLESKGIIGDYKPVRASGIKVKEAPLLQIELDEYGSVPRVFYKGEEITYKSSIDFSWVTNDEWGKNGPYIKIVHSDNQDGYLSQRTIEYEDINNE